MGYNSRCNDSVFRIRKEHLKAACEASRRVTGDYVQARNLPTRARHGGQITIEHVLDAWGWKSVRARDDVYETGDILDLDKKVEREMDELPLWQALAPYVEPGSCITMLGENGEWWRYVFDGKTVAREEGVITWARK